MEKSYNNLDSILEKHDYSWADVMEDIGLNVKNPDKRMGFYVEALGEYIEDTSTIKIIHREMKYTLLEIEEQRNKLAIANLGMLKYMGKLENTSITDKLTGLYNRRFFDITLDKTIARINRVNEDASLIIADIDSFKSFNDTHGHLAGDKVLSAMGGNLKNKTRKSDTTCRYGGEELGIILPNTNQKYALDMAYRLNCGVANHPIEFEDKNGDTHNLPVNISIGVDQIKKGESAKNLIHRVDGFLYKAKSYGRNCVVGPDGIYSPKD